jgi:hypothetical protein
LPNITTKDFAETWDEFLGMWDRVRNPFGRSFQAAVISADADIPTIANRYTGNLRRLTSLCYQLQLQWREQPFPLGCREAGKFLGVGHEWANRLLRTLKEDGVIVRVKRGHSAWKGKPGVASEWRFQNLGD